MRKITLIAALLLAVSGFSASVGAVTADFSELRQIVRGFKPGKEETAAGAVILKRQVEIEYKSDDLATTRSYFAIAVLDDKAARDYTQIEEYFNSYYSSLELGFARLIDADGNEYSVSEDAVQIKSDMEGLYYSDRKKLVFSLASVRPGSIFEFQLRETMIKKPLEKGWYDYYWFHYPQALQGGYPRVDPVREFSLTLKYPEDTKIYYKTLNSDVKPSIDVRNGYEYLVWKKRGLEKVEIEPYMPSLSKVVPSLRLSTLKDWRELDEAIAHVYMDAGTLTPQLRKLAEDVAGEMESDIEKIKAIFYFMQDNIRYISADLKRGGIVPHNAADVYSNRYGDCKDQSVLMVALLSAVGVKAYPALTGVDPSPDIDPDIPSLHFSHMIVYVPATGEDLWIDASGPPGLFPGVDWGVQGRSAFVLDGKGGALKQIPLDAPEKSMIEVHADFIMKGVEMFADFEIHMQGVMANRFKSWQMDNPRSRDSISQVISQFYPSGSVESIKLPDEKAKATYDIKARVKFPDWLESKEVVSIGGGLAPMLAQFTNLNSLMGSGRIHDFIAGYPMTLKYTASVPPPGPGYVPVVISSNYEKENAYFHAKSKVSVSDGNSRAESIFILKKKNVIPPEYPGFVKDINESSDRSAWVLTYKLDKRLSGKQQLQSTLDKNPDDVTSIVKMIRHHLESGEYEQAKTLADKAAVSHPKNGEIRYLLGVAVGFTGDYAKSSQLINESKALGFRP